MLFIKAFTSYFHIYRPPTPPYVPFGIRRFRAFTPYGVWQVVFSHLFEIRHFYSIVEIITLNNAGKGLANQDKPSTLIYT